MQKHIKAMLAVLPSVLPDAMIIAGGAAVSYGAWILHPAAGFLTGGVLAIAFGQIAAMKAGK